MVTTDHSLSDLKKSVILDFATKINLSITFKNETFYFLILLIEENNKIHLVMNESLILSAGIILYTFIQFHSTPAIVTSIFIGLGIIFCGCAMVHNVFVWQRVS